MIGDFMSGSFNLATKIKAPGALPVSSVFTLQPILPNTPSLRKSFLQRLTIIIFQHFLQRFQFILIRINLFKQRFAIGQTNVAPHFGGTAGDAGEIAQAAAGEMEQIFGMAGAAIEVIH